MQWRTCAGEIISCATSAFSLALPLGLSGNSCAGFVGECEFDGWLALSSQYACRMPSCVDVMVSMSIRERKEENG